MAHPRHERGPRRLTDPADERRVGDRWKVREENASFERGGRECFDRGPVDPDVCGPACRRKGSPRMQDRVRIDVDSAHGPVAHGRPCLREQSRPAAHIDRGSGRKEAQQRQARVGAWMGERSEAFAWRLDEFSDPVWCRHVVWASHVPASRDAGGWLGPRRGAREGLDDKGTPRHRDARTVRGCAWGADESFGQPVDRLEVDEPRKCRPQRITRAVDQESGGKCAVARLNVCGQ